MTSAAGPGPGSGDAHGTLPRHAVLATITNAPTEMQAAACHNATSGPQANQYRGVMIATAGRTPARNATRRTADLRPRRLGSAVSHTQRDSGSDGSEVASSTPPHQDEDRLERHRQQLGGRVA